MPTRRTIFKLCLSIVLFGVLGPSAHAASAISQEYQSTENLSVGMLVSSVTGKPNQVVAADAQNSATLVGVVIPSKGATISVGTSAAGYQVATSGNVTMYVIDLAGSIKAGDQITASPLKGIGMKATTGSRVVGVALADAPSGGQSTTLTGPKNEQLTTHVSSIQISIQSGEYAESSNIQRGAVVQFLQIFANNVAGKPVALTRVFLSSALLGIAILITGIMLIAGVRTTMSSLGRNPLARQSIYKGLWQVSISAIIIMLIAITGAYLVLAK